MENTGGSPHERPDWFSSLLALIGSIIVVIIVLWGLVNIANMMSPWIPSWFPKTSHTQTSTSTLPKPNIAKTNSVAKTYSNNGSKKEGSVIKNNTTRASASAPKSPANLDVRIIAVGIIDSSTGMFIESIPSSNDISAVQFDIGNIGGTSTGVWYFTATLPTQDGYTYTSPAQASLNPGDHVVNILRFTDLAQGGGVFSVIVDPETRVRESDKSNNYAEQFIRPSN